MRRKAPRVTVQWLSTVEFARRWGMSDRHVRNLIRAGVIPAIDISMPGTTRHAWRIRQDEGDAAIRALRSARPGA